MIDQPQEQLQDDEELRILQTFRANRRARIEQTEQWEPPITEKQRSIVAYPEQFLLLSGPRHSIKTNALLHAIADHCWNVPDASVAFVFISQTQATDSGAWPDLCGDLTIDIGNGEVVKTVIPEWIDGGFGMEWIEKPRNETYTHKPYFVVRNKFGGSSKVQVFSLSDEKKAAALFKGKQFTMVVITELSKFKSRDTFDALKETMRGVGRPPHHFKFIADTNPADEGSNSWIWKLWFAAEKKLPEEKDEFERELRVIRFTINDNIFYSERHKKKIIKSYEYDQTKYKINILGEWIVSQEGSFFAEQFRVNIHVPSETDDPTEYLEASPNCVELVTGWDIGSGINHSAQILEFGQTTQIMQAGGEWVDNIDEEGNLIVSSLIKVLDEEVSTGLAVGIEEFTVRVRKKMNFWERELGGRVLWRHWSDDDIFKYDAGASNWKHRIVYAASGGTIELRKASKGPNTVLPRLNLIKRLFYANNLFISKRCPRTIDAIQTLKIDKKKSGNTVSPTDPKKHAVDSMSYAILMEIGEDALTKAILAVKRAQPEDNRSAVVQVAF